MPHLVVKLLPGRDEALKSRLADALARTVIDTLGVGPETISVGIEEVAPEAWKSAVLDPEIRGKLPTLYRKPGYARV